MNLTDRHHLIWIFAALLLSCAPHSSIASEATSSAQRLAAIIDAMQVEEHWPAGVHVNWETGVPDGQAEHGAGKHTHCSAFAAAAANRVGIYLLRPPEHPQLLLANAQVDWLGKQGAQHGWQTLSDALEAQQYANRGFFVVAAYRNHRDEKPGHIAIVRPSDKRAAQIDQEGPQITQAGGTNYVSTTLKNGFAGHRAAWGGHEVRFYAHAVDPAQLGDK